MLETQAAVKLDSPRSSRCCDLAETRIVNAAVRISEIGMVGSIEHIDSTLEPKRFPKFESLREREVYIPHTQPDEPQCL